MDVVSLAQQLIRFPSITPLEVGCLDYIEHILREKGFKCQRLPFGEVDNLYARFGDGKPNFCFAGHVDVVSDIDAEQWTHPPFAATIHDGFLYGRGAVDMKGAIAAFLVVTAKYIQKPFSGSVSMLLTTDEEGPAVNGTRKVIEWLRQNNEKIDACLVGEPTNPQKVGEIVKVGRRGSLNIEIIVHGMAGHVAYPDIARNPIPVLLDYLQEITKEPLDFGTDEFSPSHLEITSVDVGNDTRNIIPAKASAKANIRFNTLNSRHTLIQKLQQIASGFPLKIDILSRPGSEAFISKNTDLIQVVENAISYVCGKKPLLSTSGGTSDARFIKDICPVIEFGLINATAHHIDERIAISELEMLATIYQRILANYFNTVLS